MKMVTGNININIPQPSAEMRLSSDKIEEIVLVVLNKLYVIHFSSVHFSHSVVSDCVAPWTAAHQTSLSITNSQSLLKLTSIESVMPSNHLILCLSPSHPTFNLSQRQGLCK